MIFKKKTRQPERRNLPRTGPRIEAVANSEGSGERRAVLFIFWLVIAFIAFFIVCLFFVGNQDVTR